MKDLYGGKVYIKDGTLMLRESKEKFHLISEVSENDIYEIIQDFLINNPTILHARVIIFESIKIATGAKSCVHCKTQSANPNIMLDDPLYAKLLSFIESSAVYKANFQKEKDRREKKKERQLSGSKNRKKELALDAFYAGQCRKNKRK